MKKETKKSLKRYLAGLVLGMGAGFIISNLAGNMGSQCTLLCDPKIAMGYFALVGFVISLK